MPANRAWFAAESVDVRMTVFMNDGATAVITERITLEIYYESNEGCNLQDPKDLKTIVKGDVVMSLLDRFG